MMYFFKYSYFYLPIYGGLVVVNLFNIPFPNHAFSNRLFKIQFLIHSLGINSTQTNFLYTFYTLFNIILSRIAINHFSYLFLVFPIFSQVIFSFRFCSFVVQIFFIDRLLFPIFPSFILSSLIIPFIIILTLVAFLLRVNIPH